MPELNGFETAELIKQLLMEIGEDPNREGLLDTPMRVATSMKFLTNGYRPNVEDVTNNAAFESEANNMISARDIEIYSMCEHHMLPFIGSANIAYVPVDKVLGVSKLARIVDCYATRLQTQERLAYQIADFIMSNLKPLGVAVVLEASHSCMTIRGVKKPGSVMVTSALRGIFRKDSRSRNEVLSLIRDGKG